MLFNSRYSFIRLLAIDSALQRESNVFFVDGEVMPYQFKARSEGVGSEKLAELFKRVYTPMASPSSTELDNLQNFLLNDSASLEVAFFNKEGVFLYDVLVGKVTIPSLSRFSVNIPCEGNTPAYFVVRFLMPSVIWDGAENYEGAYIDLLKSDFFTLAPSFDKNCFSLLEYRINKQGLLYDWVYNFVFSGDVVQYTNKVYVPIELVNLQFVTETTNYRTSAGQWKRVDSKSAKKFDLSTKSLPAYTHEAISITLLHSVVRINDEEFFLEGEYDIEYSNQKTLDVFDRLGVGSCSVYASPYLANLPTF